MKQLLYPFILIGLAACGGSSSDPATASRDDLNGPKNLQSIAVKNGDDVSVTLIWNAFNAEDELRGYDVFGVALGDLSLADLASRVTYPASFSEDQILAASFPRCDDNSTFFEAFGFPATDGEDCEAAEKDEVNSQDASGLSLADEDSPLKAKLDCDGHDSTNVSLPTEGNQLGSLKCVVKNLKDANGEAVALSAGTTYLFFVAAIAGDEYDEMSWISNTVMDTPSTRIFSDAVTVETGATPGESKYVHLALDGLSVSAAAAQSCSDEFCSLTGKTQSAASPGFYFGRDNKSSDNRERVFLSVPATADGLASDGDMSIQFKRPAVSRRYANDENLAGLGSDGFHPGDSAGTVYVTDGTHFAVYGDQIFDFQVQKDGATHYGKIIITDWKINDISDVTSEVTIDIKKAVTFNVTVVIQTQANSRDYWTD